MNLQDDSLEPQPGARLATIVDDRGALVERQTLVMAERTFLCEVGCWPPTSPLVWLPPPADTCE